MLSLARAVGLVALFSFLAMKFIPLTLWALPLWVVHAVVTGTCGSGVWVLAHECGHGAMSSRKWLNDLVGFPLHSFLLVPYFSWQYSHAVHHSRTNHLDEGETHVPGRTKDMVESPRGKFRAYIGADAFAILYMVGIHLFGWPLYLLQGVTGGPVRGVTNHFVPGESNLLFPKNVWSKVWMSTAGVVSVLAFLGYMCQMYGFWAVAAVYGGPYLVVNAWLVLYTYLHHTDENTPHYDSSSWNWTKGALCTIERNYPEIINWLHFDIGSTHVVHHLFSTLPHYNARQARVILEQKYKELYRVDKRPLVDALLSTARRCTSVTEHPEHPGEWRFTGQLR